jgi:hypothetical protein
VTSTGEIAVRRTQPTTARRLVAWIAPPQLERAGWIKTGRRLGAIGRCSQWWVGDWVLFGNGRWGEKYAEAARITGYDAHSLRNMAYVASRFELSRRRDNLSWSHHALLAPLTPAEQHYWLDRATAERLSVADLRLELQSARRSMAASDTRSQHTRSSVPLVATCPGCGLRFHYGAVEPGGSPAGHDSSLGELCAAS